MKRARGSRKSTARLSGSRHPARFRFKKEDRDKLLAVLRERLGVSPRSKAAGAFQRAVEVAIDGFGLYRKLEKDRAGARGAEVTLKQFKQHTSDLKKAMDTMGPDTRFHLELCLQAPMFQLADAARPRKQEEALAMVKKNRATRLAAQAFIDRLKKDLTNLEIAAAVAATAPQHAGSGRPKEHWRLELATEIARAFTQCFKIEPTAAPGSSFASALGVCLNAADIYVKDLDRLVLETSARTKTQASSPDRT